MTKRSRLFAVSTHSTSQVIGKCFFDQYDMRMDAGILVLAQRAALILGYEGERLETLLRDEFAILDVTQSAIIDTWLAALDLVDVEKRIRATAGGRNWMLIEFSTVEEPATAAAKKKRDQRRTGEPKFSANGRSSKNGLRNLKKIC
jgi:hypothetical protein